MIRKYIPPVAKNAIKKVMRHLRTDVVNEQTPIFPCKYSIDSPTKTVQDKQTVAVEGWIIPNHGNDIKGIRAQCGGSYTEVPFGLKRIDVARAFPEESAAMNSGFSVTLPLVDGVFTIEVDLGKGYKEIYKLELRYSPERLVSDYINPDLAKNYADHQNLIENRRKFYHESESLSHFERDDKDPRIVSIYLPQFHPFEENDKAWGKGFTEWTNVSSGQPRFIGHQQPILPQDLGFYDLRLESNILDQINLAKKYGVYGFCFYYYWFSGKKIMDKPLNSFLSHKEWDFNFTICWANENWTKRWDGRDKDVIIAQKYLEEDPLNFIKNVENILLDPRYITEDGKPVLMVYRASELKDPKKYVKVWRNYFRERHNMELQLVSYLSFEDRDPREYGFDAALDFAPLSAFFKNHLFKGNQYPYIDVGQKLLDINFSGVVADYRTIALNQKLSKAYDFPTYPCITPSWDNDARKKGKGFVFQNSSPDIYAKWLGRTIKEATANSDAPLVFVNAWNEWAEGAVMEPSQHLGHTILKRTAEVLSSYSLNPANKSSFPLYGIENSKMKKIAVVVHLYYIDLWPEIQERLDFITEQFDLFVTLNERDKEFEPTLSNAAVRIRTFVLPNRGRDVLPSLYVVQRIRSAGYEYVLKLHSKKSKHRIDGSTWFDSVLDSLLPNSKTISEIIVALNRKDVGIIGPNHHLVSLKRNMGSNSITLTNLIQQTHDNVVADKVISHPENYPYFGGTMFWSRMDALDPILDLCLMPDDFQPENGQLDGTMAHALERMFGIVCRLEGKSLLQVDKNGIVSVGEEPYDEKYEYAP